MPHILLQTSILPGVKAKNGEEFKGKMGEKSGHSGWEDTLNKGTEERVWNRYSDVTVVLCNWNTELLGVSC